MHCSNCCDYFYNKKVQTTNLTNRKQSVAYANVPMKINAAPQTIKNSNKLRKEWLVKMSRTYILFSGNQVRYSKTCVKRAHVKEPILVAQDGARPIQVVFQTVPLK